EDCAGGANDLALDVGSERLEILIALLPLPVLRLALFEHPPILLRHLECVVGHLGGCHVLLKGLNLTSDHVRLRRRRRLDGERHAAEPWFKSLGLTLPWHK